MNTTREKGIFAISILVITMIAFSMSLNNSGDDISLIDDQGNTKHHESYTSSQVRSGVLVRFE